MSRRERSLAAWARRRVRVLLSLRSDEQGATAVMVAILSVLMLGMLGFVVDYGVVEAKRSQLQVAADAAALAIANDCSAGITAECRADGSGLSLAVLNDAESVSATLDAAQQQVTVTTGDRVEFSLMHTLGLIGADLEADATAEWTMPSSTGGSTRATVYPFVVAECAVTFANSTQQLSFTRSLFDSCGFLFDGREVVRVADSCAQLELQAGEWVEDFNSVFWQGSCALPTGNTTIVVPVWDEYDSRLFGRDRYRIVDFVLFDPAGNSVSGAGGLRGRFLPFDPNHPDISTVGGVTTPGTAQLIG